MSQVLEFDKTVTIEDINTSSCLNCAYHILISVDSHRYTCHNCGAIYYSKTKGTDFDLFKPKFYQSPFQLVSEFQQYFGITGEIGSTKPQLVDGELFLFKIRHLKEEIDELIEAYKDEDLVKTSDAIIDIVYVVLGLASNMNIPFDYLFYLVHSTNMKKERVENPEDSKRGCQFDVIKPEGWKSPEPIMRQILKELRGDV